MKFSSDELEFRLLNMLKMDSRVTVSEISRQLGTNRLRVRKAMERLVINGYIKRFTIETSEEEDDLLVARVRNMDHIDHSGLIESFNLIDGTHMVVIPYSRIHILDGIDVLDLSFARQRNRFSFISGKMTLKCDLCGNSISENPFTVEKGGRVLYGCCPNCQQELRDGKIAKRK